MIAGVIAGGLVLMLVGLMLLLIEHIGAEIKKLRTEQVALCAAIDQVHAALVATLAIATQLSEQQILAELATRTSPAARVPYPWKGAH